MKTSINYLREIANGCAAVEFYTSDTMSYPHTDNVESLDVDFDSLADEVNCSYYEMSESDYNESLMANCDSTVDFEDEYGNKDAKVLVVVINANSEYLK